MSRLERHVTQSADHNRRVTARFDDGCHGFAPLLYRGANPFLSLPIAPSGTD
jgi:hypothetical protein